MISPSGFSLYLDEKLEGSVEGVEEMNVDRLLSVMEIDDNFLCCPLI